MDTDLCVILQNSLYQSPLISGQVEMREKDIHHCNRNRFLWEPYTVHITHIISLQVEGRANSPPSLPKLWLHFWSIVIPCDLPTSLCHRPPLPLGFHSTSWQSLPLKHMLHTPMSLLTLSLCPGSSLITTQNILFSSNDFLVFFWLFSSYNSQWKICFRN